MKRLPDKIRSARCALDMSQTRLGELAGVSLRSICAYEKGEKVPRERTLYQLARALGVSVRYLKDDSCTDPSADMQKDAYIADMGEKYGSRGARDIAGMLEANRALFAGGELSQEEKDIYFDALMTAYVTCREAAKDKFGKNKG